MLSFGEMKKKPTQVSFINIFIMSIVIIIIIIIVVIVPADIYLLKANHKNIRRRSESVYSQQ